MQQILDQLNAIDQRRRYQFSKELDKPTRFGPTGPDGVRDPERHARWLGWKQKWAEENEKMTTRIASLESERGDSKAKSRRWKALVIELRVRLKRR